MKNEIQNYGSLAEGLRRQAIACRNNDLASKQDEIELQAPAEDGLLVALKILSAVFGCFCIYVALQITAGLFGNPNAHDAFVLGLFLAMAGIGFLIWAPKKYQRKCAAAISLFIAILEVAVNVAIILK